MGAALEVRGLAKRYGRVQALAGVDLTVEEGEVFGFLGPNGAGKTTFTKCVTGFVRPDKGRVRLCGIDALRSAAHAARNVGLVPDQYDFYPNLTGRQHLDFYGRLFGLSKQKRRRRIERVLELVDMTDRADRKVKGYSHGMKQRTCIAQAILHAPRLVILDEPTNGLDPKGAYELRRLISRLADHGITVFLNSHVLSEVEQICNRVAIVDQGRVQAIGSVGDLKARFGTGGGIRVRLGGLPKAAAAAVERLAGAPPRRDGASWWITAPPAQAPDVVRALVGGGADVLAVEPVESDLESVFLKVTGGR